MNEIRGILINILSTAVAIALGLLLYDLTK